MTRERQVRVDEALEKCMKVINKLNETTHSCDVTKNVKITSSLTIEINAIVNDFEDSAYYGKPMWFEVYAIKKGIAVDCMTIDMHRSVRADITYLLNCYI